MRTTLLSVFIATSVLLLTSAGSSAQDTIKVFVTAEGADSGFSSGKGTSDSVKDLTRAFSGKRRLSLTNSERDADIVVQVASRDSHWDTGAVYNYKSSSGKDHYFTTTRKKRVVYAMLKVQDYTHQFHGQGSTWTAASDSVARQVDKWVDQNIVKLIELRQATAR